MHHRKVGLGTILALVLALALPSLADATQLPDTYHQDHRKTPKLQLNPVTPDARGLSDEALARVYLQDNAAMYGLVANADELKLLEAKQSLLGTHLRFQQQIDGVDVLDGQIVVSIAKHDGRIYRVSNNIYPAKPELQRNTATLDQESAFDIAWNHLRAHGDLTHLPSAKLVWLPEGADFRLAWMVKLDLTGPYGGWEVKLDARTGRVVDTRDTHLYRVKDTFTETPVAQRIAAHAGPVANRAAAFAAAEAKQAAAEARAAELARRPTVNGSGQVFDPDPRTTLMNDNIQDGDPASTFTSAYFTRTLEDITENAGTYSLVGPWVTIVDFDPPSTAPSTTSDGNWNFTRGNIAFNDAMTYYFLDISQRYIQSLGFTGATGIQELSMGADANGFNGADNSFYSPSSNQVAFGHGCVDDNEDADVILHEYGHAITYGINSGWGGGDAGAIGEGFGDYWAGSYSWSTPNGKTYHPEWVYTWDGHGTGNLCWNGRIMDAFGALYVHSTTYGAHSSIPGGYVSDELWSTPLFQSLVDLDGLGVPREEVDQIVLEGMFGLAAGFKMRELANNTVAAANALFPSGPHADEFLANFQVHDIIEFVGAEIATEAPAVLNGGPNSAADPGETVDLTIDLTNNGNVTATSVNGVLSSTTSGVVVSADNSGYPDVAPAGTVAQTTNYTVFIPSTHPCGDPVTLSLLVTYDDGTAQNKAIPLVLPTGVPNGANESASPNLAIPDNNPIGITTNIVVSGAGSATVTAGFNVDLDITHTWIGDLIVTLTSPSNTSVVLHDRTGFNADDIVGNYPGTLTPEQSLATLIGEPLDGTWQLTVSDNAGFDLGTLNSWGINDVTGYTCEAPTSTPPGTATPVAFKLYNATPNPFGSTSAIRFEVPGDGADISLAVFDVAGRRVAELAKGFYPAGIHTASWNGLNIKGDQATTGVYFYRLTSGKFTSTRKLMLLR